MRAAFCITCFALALATSPRHGDHDDSASSSGNPGQSDPANVAAQLIVAAQLGLPPNATARDVMNALEAEDTARRDAAAAEAEQLALPPTDPAVAGALARRCFRHEFINSLITGYAFERIRPGNPYYDPRAGIRSYYYDPVSGRSSWHVDRPADARLPPGMTPDQSPSWQGGAVPDYTGRPEIYTAPGAGMPFGTAPGRGMWAWLNANGAAAMALVAAQGPLFTCQFCYDDNPLSQMAMMEGCQHLPSVCNECMVTSIQTNPQRSITCQIDPAFNPGMPGHVTTCGQPLTSAVIHGLSHLSSSPDTTRIATLYRHSLVREYNSRQIAQNPGMRYIDCPRPGCVNTEAVSGSELLCSVCGYNECVDCSVSGAYRPDAQFHTGITCNRNQLTTRVAVGDRVPMMELVRCCLQDNLQINNHTRLFASLARAALRPVNEVNVTLTAQSQALQTRMATPEVQALNNLGAMPGNTVLLHAPVYLMAAPIGHFGGLLLPIVPGGIISQRPASVQHAVMGIVTGRDITTGMLKVVFNGMNEIDVDPAYVAHVNPSAAQTAIIARQVMALLP